MHDEMARRLMRHFPGWRCWYGAATRAWWTMPPPDYWYPSLIEAPTPEQLAARIAGIRTATQRVAVPAA